MISIQQAACDALTRWIQANITDATVSSRWPTVDRPLPNKAITVITAGARQDTDIEARLLAQTDLANNQASIVWQIKVCEQPLQLDVWAKTDAERDDLLARLDDVLNYGEAALGLAGEFYDPARTGLLLPVVDGWPTGTTADFTFDGPDTPDTSDAAKRAEFRGMIRGSVYVALTVTRTSVLQVQLILKQRLNDGADVDVMTITPTDQIGSTE